MSQKPNTNIFTGLDVGSTKVCCVIGLQEDDAPAPTIVGVGTAPGPGARKGVIVDIEDTVSAISAAVDEAERIAGTEVERATVGVNGGHLTTLGSQGIIAVGGGREITLEDIERVEEAASTVQLPPNREIIQIFARNYTIDGQENIKDPVGMSGMRLEVETRLITAATPSLRNLSRAVHQAGITVDSQTATPIAAAHVVLDKRQRELGSVVVDIGGGTTGIAVYDEGELLHASVIPVGSSHISQDLAIGLRTDIDTAEKVKLEHVAARDKHRQKQGVDSVSIEELNGDVMTISRKEINSIARARLEEIFDLVNEEIVKVKPDLMLPGGVFLTGGGANLPGLDDFVKEALKLPAKVAKPRGFTGVINKINDPALAVPIGLMLENMEVAGMSRGMTVSLRGLKTTLRNIWDRFKP